MKLSVFLIAARQFEQNPSQLLRSQGNQYFDVWNQTLKSGQ